MSKAHARLAPSSAAATVQCPGSVVMRERYPDPGDTEAAREGEAAHWVVEQMIEGVILPVGTPAPNSVIVTPEMLGGGRMMVQDMQDQLGEQWREMVRVEQTLPPDPGLSPHCFGTPDAVAIRGRMIYIWDYKFGFGPVPVRDNWQLITYLMLLVYHAGIKNDLDYTVRFAIAQPRDYLSGVHGVKSLHVPLGHLRAEFNVLRGAFAEALGPNPRLRVGPECKNCSARARCPELLRAGLREADWGMGAVPHDLTPAAMGLELRMLDRAIATLEARRNGLVAQAERLIMSGAQVPGYALSRSEGRTVWSKDAPVVINTGKMLGFDLAKPAEAITPKQALALGVPETLVRQWSEMRPGAAKLVPEAADAAAKAFG